MRPGSRSLLAIVSTVMCVLPLLIALMVGLQRPAQGILPELPPSAPADYTSRFGTGFVPLREAFIQQVLGRRGFTGSSGMGPVGLLSRFGGSAPPASRDLLAALNPGDTITLTPGDPNDPSAPEFWRSRDPSISDDGSVVAYLSTDTRIEGMDPLQSCYRHAPPATAWSAYWHATRFQSNYPQVPDPGPCDQVVVQDVRTSETTIASVGLSGELANAPTHHFMLSGSGRYVVFSSGASNLVPNDTNDLTDVFVRDLQTGRTELISESIHGGPIRAESQDYVEQMGNGAGVQTPDVLGSLSAEYPTISSDGRYVAFESSAADLVPGDTPQSVDVFVRDRLSGTTERVSVSTSGEPASREDVYRDNNERLSTTSVWSATPCMSPNGRYVAFRSWGSNLVQRDRNGRPDIFLRDRRTGTTELITLSTSGEQQDGDARPGIGYPWHHPFVFSLKSCVSDDGRYVVFRSSSTNLVDDDTNETTDIFLRDRKTSSTRRVSVNADGSEANVPRGRSYCGPPDVTCEGNPPPTGDTPDLSTDGRFIAFHSIASLTPDDPDGGDAGMDLFIYEIATARVVRLDVKELARTPISDLVPESGYGTVMAPTLSRDASLVALKTVVNINPGGVRFTAGIFLHRWRR